MTEPRKVEAPRVLGIDPGTRVVGYGIIDAHRGAPRAVAHGAIRLPKAPIAARLETIFREVRALVDRYRPQVLAIEEVFQGKNFQSVLKVGEARGVVILAAQLAGIEIREYAPARIKKAATGNGNAAKVQVEGMMTRMLGIGEASSADETDALAVAYCHAQGIGRAMPEARSEPETPARRALREAARVRRRRLPLSAGSADANSSAAVSALLERGAARAVLGASFRNRRRAGGRRR
jgi:crossover junction endodeoxyribonuclease RuvC